MIAGLFSSPATADDAADCVKETGDKAIAACTRRIEGAKLIGRDLAVSLAARGGAFRSKNDLDHAIADYDAAIRADATFAEAFRRRGMAWRDKGDPDKAIADFSGAIQLEPKNAQTFRLRAYVWRIKNDLDRSMTDLDEAIRLDPKFVDALNERAFVWQLKRDFDRALADSNEAIRLNPKYPLLFHDRAAAWRNKRDFDKAIADYSEAIRLGPKYMDAYYRRGLTWQDKGDLDKAIADFGQAIQLDPKNAPLFRARAFAWRNKNDFDHAIADFSQAILLDPKLVIAYNDRAFTWLRKGDFDRAMADYNEGIRLDPKIPVLHLDRGIAWARKKDSDRALADFSEAIRLGPRYVLAFNQRGLLYEQMGALDKALADFKAAVAINPQFAIAAEHAARIEQKLGAGANGKPGTPPAAGEARIALVIGNGAYKNAPALPNPANDAKAVAATLREIGFTVLDGTNLDRAGMERLIRDFLHKAPSARVSVIFYAGHGMQVDGKNYLVPVDAKLVTASDLSFETIDMDQILGGLDDANRANIVILDACRDNPFAQGLAKNSRSIGAASGLAAISTVGTGTLIAYATAPGQTAQDGAGANSPFTTALLKHIRTPGAEVNQMLTRVRVEVAGATKNKQIPWANSSLLGEIYLAGDVKH